MDGPRLLRPVGAPLGVYLRPGRNDHTTLLNLAGEGVETFAGIVFDPCQESRQSELKTEALEAGLEAVLDSRALELGTEVGFGRSGMSKLPWAAASHDEPETLKENADEFIGALAEFVVDKGFSAVLAPTHYLGDDDTWFEVDRLLTRRLRSQLDALGGEEVLIYYPLALHAEQFRQAALRQRTVHYLRPLPIDALWLRVHPFGANSGPRAVRRYIEASRDFHQLGIPLVAEHVGAAGVALLAFGAVGGIESGITYGEQYDVGQLFRPPRGGTPFSPPPRVYLHQLGAFLSRPQAEAFFDNRHMKSTFGCRDTACCRRGVTDTLRDPRPHFVRQRLREVAELSRAPEALRTQLYLDDFLRPASDLAVQAARVEPALERARKRLDSWRVTLGTMARDGVGTSFAAVPEGQRIHHRRTA
jgi:hypothetical protein